MRWLLGCALLALIVVGLLAVLWLRGSRAVDRVLREDDDDPA